MNWWMLAGGLMTLICALGDAIIGWSMFYRPISSVITDLHAGVFTGMWHLITIHFALSAVALLVLAARGRGDAAACSLPRNLPGTPRSISLCRCIWAEL